MSSMSSFLWGWAGINSNGYSSDYQAKETELKTSKTVLVIIAETMWMRGKSGWLAKCVNVNAKIKAEWSGQKTK